MNDLVQIDGLDPCGGHRPPSQLKHIGNELGQLIQLGHDRLLELAPYWDATDPDLRPFQRAGGKLILWQGEADWSIPTITSIAYYQAVVNAMGGLAATQRFAKYYLLPSVGHCGGNGPDTYNGLGAVVAWTERHISPTALVSTQYAPATSGGGPGRPRAVRAEARRRPT